MSSPLGFLFFDPRAKPLSTAGIYQPGCYLQFYLTGTTTFTNVYADGNLTTPLSQTPISGNTTAAADGRFVPIYLDPSTIYRVQLYSAVGILLEDTDPVSGYGYWIGDIRKYGGGPRPEVLRALNLDAAANFEIIFPPGAWPMATKPTVPAY